MKQVRGKDLCKAVARKGWRLVRVRGSHHVNVKDGRRERLVVPVHGNQPLKVGLLRALMKIAELGEEEI